MRVKALDSHLINIIAAGEVVDRPASIAKELVENSLDAGARRVEIEARDGGVGLLRVADDGAGIAADELELAIQRHTTSKIASEADLEAIATLGFRGEALASICEVARVRLSSRTAGADAGRRVVVAGGVVEAVEAVGRAPGTEVEVRDLFYNLPARRKFLKSEKTETLHLTRLVKRFMFSHPQVHFSLSHGARAVLDSPPGDDLVEVAAHLYGAKVARGLVPLDHRGAALRVYGWVSAPQLARGDRNEQYLFVNRRAVSDAVVQYAVNRAFEGVLERQRHPYVCLHIEIDPRRVDVNVHPQKHEVRFQDPQAVKRDLIQALGAALVSQHAAPQLPWRAAEAALRYRPQPPAGAGSAGGTAPPPGAHVDLRAEWAARRQRPADLPAASQRPDPPPAAAPLVRAAEARVIGQLHGTYIVVQTPEGFELIDQHVAHERILYERFLGQLAAGEGRVQRLLVPEPIQAAPDLAQALGHQRDRLAALGIDIGAFGPDTFLVRGWPEALAEHHARTGYRAALEHLLHVLEEEGDPPPETLARALVASLACEAAVVKNTPLPPEAMRRLVADLKSAADPFHCPHGRPISLRYGLAELERAFKRR